MKSRRRRNLQGSLSLFFELLMDRCGNACAPYARHLFKKQTQRWIVLDFYLYGKNRRFNKGSNLSLLSLLLIFNHIT